MAGTTTPTDTEKASQTGKKRKTRTSRPNDISGNGLIEAKFGVDVGDIATKEFLLKCRCYIDYDKYLGLMGTDANTFKFGDISHLKEALQVLKSDEVLGGVILQKFDHPNLRENSVILKVLTHDARVVAATIMKPVLEKYVEDEKRNTANLPN